MPMTSRPQTGSYGPVNQKPLQVLHFSPAASFDGKFLFHPVFHDAKEAVHFFATGRSGFKVDQSTIFQIASEYLRAARVLLKGLGMRNRQSLAYCHTTLYALPALVLCRLCGVGEVIYFNHGVPYVGHRGLRRWILKLIDRFNVLVSHRFLTISPTMVSFLRKDADPRRHSTLPGSSSGLRSRDFTDRNTVCKRPDLRSRPLRYLYAGRLQERKGVFVLLDAWRLHARRYPEDELWLCGFSQQEFGDLGAWSDLTNVIVHGYVVDMACIYNQVDVVISPSFHEGFGYTLLEGAARGCCIVSSNVPGPDVLFTRWMQGQRFKVGSADSLSRVMADLSASPMALAIASRLSYRSALRFDMANISYPHLTNRTCGASDCIH